MFLPGDLSRTFTPTDHPFWRSKTSSSSDDMLSKVCESVRRFEKLPQEKKSWAKNRYLRDRALGEFLHQVNFIESEGFATHKETQKAIASGLLNEPGGGTTKEEQHVHNLHKAWKHWFQMDDQQLLSCLTVGQVVQAHSMLLGSTNKDLAGVLRCKDDQLVCCKTGANPDDLHVFMWPTEVPSALARLLECTRKAMAEVLELNGTDKVTKLVVLAGSFFMEFESIHPFLDGNGRMGRILVSRLLKGIMPFPNTLLVDDLSNALGNGEPPFVDHHRIYYHCFKTAQVKQKWKMQKGKVDRCICKKQVDVRGDYPRDLTALLLEGVFVAWKRFFANLGSR